MEQSPVLTNPALDRGKPAIWLSLLLAIVSGILLDFGFPDLNLWPLSFLGIWLLFYAIRGRGFWWGVQLGALAGIAFYGVHIYWISYYLGPVPWFALTFAMVLSFCLGVGLFAWATKKIPASWGKVGTLLVYPVLAGGIWVLREGIASRFPYDGFSWARLAFAHSDSWYSHLLSWVGSAGLAFLLVTLSALSLQIFFQTELKALVKPIPVLSMLLLPLLVPVWAPVITGEIKIAAVQGNANAALNAGNPRGSILLNHYEATKPLYGQKVDLVIWPENASDLDPLRYQASADVLDEISTELEAPILVGTITQRDEKIYNTSIFWQAGQAMVDWYDKAHPVPFGEYMPDRDFFYFFTPDLVSLVTRNYEKGERDPIFNLEGYNAGILICYDVADDYLVNQLPHQGADIIVVQTNNADFGPTDQSLQQLAIAKVRAYETARTVVNISTVGTSAIIGPDGKIISQLEAFTSGTMVETVQLATGITPATAISWYLEAAVSLIALLLILALLATSIVNRAKKKAKVS